MAQAEQLECERFEDLVEELELTKPITADFSIGLSQDPVRPWEIAIAIPAGQEGKSDVPGIMRMIMLSDLYHDEDIVLPLSRPERGVSFHMSEEGRRRFMGALGIQNT